jgi:hypothetical protein
MLFKLKIYIFNKASGFIIQGILVLGKISVSVFRYLHRVIITLNLSFLKRNRDWYRFQGR